MIIDAHVHAFSFHPTRGLEQSVDQSQLLLEEMDTYGITTAVVQYGVGSNEQIQSLVRKYPERFVGFCGWDATSGKEAAETIQKWLKEPEFKGVGECRLFQFVVRQRVETLPALLNEVRMVMDVVSQNKVPILFHTGFFHGAPPGRPIIPLMWKDPMLLDEIAAEYPNTPIIIGHCGGPYAPHDQNALIMAYNYDNVYLETSRSRADVVEKAVSEIGASRVLFGSDWVGGKPLSHGPSSERESHLYSRNLRVIEETRISDKDKEMILFKNVKLLLDLPR